MRLVSSETARSAIAAIHVWRMPRRNPRAITRRAIEANTSALPSGLGDLDRREVEQPPKPRRKGRGDRRRDVQDRDGAHEKRSSTTLHAEAMCVGEPRVVDSRHR